MCEATGQTILTEGGDAIAVIADEGRIELHGLDADYGPVSLSIELGLL